MLPPSPTATKVLPVVAVAGVYVIPRRLTVPIGVPTFQLVPAARGVNVTGALSGPPGPPLILPLMTAEYVVPLMRPVSRYGEATPRLIVQPTVFAQLSELTVGAAAIQSQYSTSDSMFQKIVALLSCGTATTLVGADAELPPPQPAIDQAAKSARSHEKTTFIAIPCTRLKT